jgi:hypothetical protein
MASPLSNMVKPEATGAAIGRGAAVGADDDLAAVAGVAIREGVAEELGGVGGGGFLVGTGAGAVAIATATGAAAVLAGAAEPGASVGSLIVGAEVGLGGKLMRTVSFFGRTFEASAGFGGSAPPGGVGVLSAISFILSSTRRVAVRRCQTRILTSIQALVSS